MRPCCTSLPTGVQSSGDQPCVYILPYSRVQGLGDVRLLLYNFSAFGFALSQLACYRNYVYTKIYSEGEFQFTGPTGDEAKEADSEQAAIVNNSEKVSPKEKQQQQAEPVDLMSRNSPLATPPPPPTEGSSVEDESMQSGAEEKGEEVEEGREEGGGGYSDGTSYGSTLGESYLEESRKEAAEKPHHPNLLEKESYSGYREQLGGGKDGYQGGGGGGGKESYHHGVSSYMGVSNSYNMGAAGNRMGGGEMFWRRCDNAGYLH